MSHWWKVLFTDIQQQKESFRPPSRRRANEPGLCRTHPQTRRRVVRDSFARTAVGDLIGIEGILMKEDLDILKQNDVSNGLRLSGKGFVLQHDNDPKHSTKHCWGFVHDLNKTEHYPTWFGRCNHWIKIQLNYYGMSWTRG